MKLKAGSTSLALYLRAATVCLIAAGALSAVNAHASIVLVDYDPAVRNGGFETATLSGSPLEASFVNTAQWTNLGGFQTDQAVREGLARSGSNSGVLTDSGKIFALDTGYTMSAGDVVDFSYWWRDAFNWAVGSDQVQFSIFTTADDTIFGTLDQSASLLSGLSSQTATYQEHAGSFAIGAAMDGKRLFISLEGIDGNNNPNGFARLDDVFVQVTPIPEPSVAFLGGLGLLVLLARRRR